eukprot:g47569.t1
MVLHDLEGFIHCEAQKEIQCWSKAVEEHFQDCLETVDWTVFKYLAKNLDEYAATITDFVSKCVEDCVPKKLIWVFPNRKPWLNREIHSLLKTRRTAFTSNDPDLYRKSRYDLRKTIRDAKRQHQIGLPRSQPKESDRLGRVPGYALRSCADQLAEVHSRCHFPSNALIPGKYGQGHLRQTPLIDFSSAFIAIISSRQILKLEDLGLGSTFFNLILSFLTHRPQSIKTDNCTSSMITLNTGAPTRMRSQSLYAHDCVAKFQMKAIYKFAVKTTLVRQISNNDESEYRKKIQGLVTWCNDNNLSHNGKSKELFTDFRKEGEEHTLIYINGAAVEKVGRIKSRLADFLTNCQPSAQSLSGCFRENYAACLLSYSGLIGHNQLSLTYIFSSTGSDMTPNYIDATDIVVAPWCTCSGSGNQKEECDKFLNYFKANTCLRNAMQAFGNGTDVNMWKSSLPTLATSLLKTEKTIESAQPSDHIKEITTADDANILTMCSDLQ